MLAETAGSIVIKTDAGGFIEDASRGIEALGLRLAEMLFRPHIADLALAGHATAVRAFHDEALKGRAPTAGRLEFPVSTPSGEAAWYSLSLRPAPDEDGRISGTLGLLRSVEGRRSLEDELAAAAMTDTVTGLANGRAFHAMLAQLLVHGAPGALAIFEIDRFASLKLNFGHAIAQEMLWAFGRFLSNVLPEDFILARLDGDRFAVLMPGCTGAAADDITRDILATFAGLSSDAQRAETRLSASAGIAPIAGSIDAVMINAERALVVARALGGRRAEIRDSLPPWHGQRTGT
ncbi:GGDEF domain-containing protein [Altererythrobacter sp. Z27]|uniref:GGDEF domain-containing protein n=1 Tax=Altererythrobacter sp. Z27 TaxID=3461147 RepID=UPI004043A4E4